MVFDEDEKFELISKVKLESMKEEITKLKEKLETSEKENNESGKEITEEVEESLNKALSEEDLTNKEISELKEINKRILDLNISIKESIDNKLVSFLDNFKMITTALKEILDEFKDLKLEINSLLEEKDNSEINQFNKEHFIKIEERISHYETDLKRIESFMNNLSILLAQVDPNSIKFNSPNFNSKNNNYNQTNFNNDFNNFDNNFNNLNN